MPNIYDFANLCRNCIEFDKFVAKISKLLVGLLANVIPTSTPCLRNSLKQKHELHLRKVLDKNSSGKNILRTKLMKI